MALCLLIMFVVCAIAQPNPTTVQTQKKRIVIGARMLLDGRGNVLRDTRIVVEGSKILALDPKASLVDYDLRGFTVLPRRWVVERTFGWLGRWRRTSKDYEYLPATSECVVYAIMVRIMLRRLADSDA